MIKAISKQAVAFDDFCFLVKEGQKAELLDGVIYMASPDNIDANRRSKWLVGLVDGAPDWALEIVSPESIERDYEKKRLQYEEHGSAE